MLTIIVPHKNSIDSLIRLLDSIGQDSGAEVIVVDDYSNHKNDPLAYSEEYPNASFFRNDGDSNAGNARNIGLFNISQNSDWVMFADADDYFIDGFIPKLTSYLKQHDEFDLIYYNCTSVIDKSGEVGTRHENYDKLITSHNKDDLRYLHHVPWCKVIRKNLISSNSIQFDSVIASNDVMFSLKVGVHAKCIGIYNQIGYCVTENSGSLTATITPTKAKARLLGIVRYNRFLISNKILDRMRFGGWRLLSISIFNINSSGDVSLVIRFISLQLVMLFIKIKLWLLGLLKF